MIRVMAARIIDGRALARAYRSQITDRVEAMGARESGGVPVRLDAILVGSGDTGARVYAQSQARTCRSVGIHYELHDLPDGTDEGEVAGVIDSLNADAVVSAIMLHLPVPEGMDAYRLQARIGADKDCEGVNPANIGNIVYGRSSLVPCTALAVIRMIESTGVEVPGSRAVVVGASNHVGKPIAVLLMRRDATVVSCNKWTAGLEDLCRSADILVAAAGVPGLIRAGMVRPGAVVVDVGVNRIEGPGGERVTVGDVAYDEVSGVAGWISPVPGGVGPVTVAMLLQNAVEAAERAAGGGGGGGEEGGAAGAE